MAILQSAPMSCLRYYARNEWPQSTNGRLSHKRDDDSAWIQKTTKSYPVVTWTRTMLRVFRTKIERPSL